MKPISPARYKVEFTAGAELRDKLERLRSLMRSSVPDGDIGAIIEEAVTEKLERLEAKRFAKTKTPERASKRPTRRLLHATYRLRSNELSRSVTRISALSLQTTVGDVAEREGLEFHHRKTPTFDFAP